MTLWPWTLIFGVLVIILSIYPGFKSAFSDVIGYFWISKSANEIMSQLLIDKLSGTQGWGESSVNELVDLMEEVYQGRLRVDPHEARESMLLHTWEHSIDSMMDLF